jgi:hypothetical protein
MQKNRFSRRSREAIRGNILWAENGVARVLVRGGGPGSARRGAMALKTACLNSPSLNDGEPGQIGVGQQGPGDLLVPWLVRVDVLKPPLGNDPLDNEPRAREFAVRKFSDTDNLR